MRSYEAARRSFSLFETLARIVISVGAIFAIAGGVAAAGLAGNGPPPLLAAIVGALPGALIALFGFSNLATAQMGRASVDSAEYGQQSLQIAREQLELSRQAQFEGRRDNSSFAKQKSETAPAKDSQDTKVDASKKPSYSDMPKDTPASAQTTSATRTDPNARPALSETDEISHLIEYDSGRFITGGKKFWSRPEAEAHARETLLKSGADK